LELRLEGTEKLQFDTVTTTYPVVEGDDLIEIGESFEVSVDEPKAPNTLTS
jgi:LysM repeat protein